MTYHYIRSYRGQVELAIFDWAGTTVDYGCQAPIAAFVESFGEMGVEVSMEAARGPMGMEKRDHIREVFNLDEVAASWLKAHGRAVTEADIDGMYSNFIALLLKQLAVKSTLIPGVLEAVSELREMGISIGSSTGYFREAAEVVKHCAAKEGYIPDYSICASDVPSGRPMPWMIYRVMENLGVYPPEAVVAVGDTPVDVESGLNAGVWTVGVAATGNQLGLTLKEVEEFDPELYGKKLDKARTSLARAGAHFVIDTTDELPEIIEEIDSYLAVGEKP